MPSCEQRTPQALLTTTWGGAVAACCCLGTEASLLLDPTDIEEQVSYGSATAQSQPAFSWAHPGLPHIGAQKLLDEGI